MKISYTIYKLLSVLILGCLVIFTSCQTDSDIEPDENPGGQTPQDSIAELSSEKDLVKFLLKASDNSSLGKDVNGTIDQNNQTIFVVVPNGSNIAALTPVIEISDKATVSPNGVQDFTDPVTYTVTAEDGSQKKYVVTLMDVSTSQRTALIAIYDANPGNTIDWDFNDPDINNWDGVTAKNNEGYVTFLRIAQKGISIIPDEISLLTKLNYIDFNYNQLNSISPKIGTLQELTYLNLNDNELTSVPQEIGQLTNLQGLVLYNNQLSSIPTEIGQLTQLTALELSGNKLTSVPPEIGQLTKLEGLALDNNQLTSIPAEVGQLTKLLYLILSVNKLTSIPAEAGQLTGLIELYANDNQLSSIPAEIGQLTNLVNLYLPNNQLTSIPQEVCDLETNHKTNITVDTGVICE
jgi:Leucine-rich repeat (LRR) protein